jgi:DNA-binding transcriptional MerR regulator
MPTTLSIREVTRTYSVTARTLRFYEDEGLLTPERTNDTPRRQTVRRYGPDALAALRLILDWRHLGFSIAEIRTHLALPTDQRPAHARNKYAERDALLADTQTSISAIRMELGSLMCGPAQ